MRMKGFSMVELVVVISILGILSVLFGPRMTGTDTFALASASDELGAVLKLGQKLAVKQRRTIHVVTSGGVVELCRSSTSPCPSGDEVQGVSGSGTVSVAMPQGVVLTAAALSFGSDGQASSGVDYSLSKGSESRVVHVVKETGFVYE